MYTGIRFKGIVKPEFRKEATSIAIFGEWENADSDFFREFGKLGRSNFIPNGTLCYMPNEWANGDFSRVYDEDSGYWSFHCSLKNYEDEIERFFEIIPKFIEKVECLEYYYEEWQYSERYDLVNGKVVLVDKQFIKYQ